jgi:hypothetical protein
MEEPGLVFRLTLPFSANYMKSGDVKSWLNMAKEDAARFDCRISWRAARRVALSSPDEKPPYIVTVVGKHGAVILQSLQDTIYANWPLSSPPPPREEVTWDPPDPSVYTFYVCGQPPVDVRMFSFKGLIAAREQKQGGINAPRIKSHAPKLPNPAKDLTCYTCDTPIQTCTIHIYMYICMYIHV